VVLIIVTKVFLKIEVVIQEEVDAVENHQQIKINLIISQSFQIHIIKVQIRNKIY
jgi:hypothetical protein